MMNKRITISVCCILLVFGCAKSPESEFRDAVARLRVPANIADALWRLQVHHGAKSENDFKLIRAFCAQRQIAYRNAQSDLPDVLTKVDIRSLFGDPHDLDDAENWIYYFNSTKTWHIRLEFKEDDLFYTGYSQMIPAEKLVDNQNIERTSFLGPLI